MAKFKYIVASLMATAALASSAVGLTASANNHDDTDFNVYSVNSSNKYTASRTKTDTTSATVRVDSVSSYGAKMTVHVCTGSYVDKTYGTPKTVGVSSYYTYCPSTVYEDGYRTARLGFTRASGASSFNASGVWSPDSI